MSEQRTHFTSTLGVGDFQMVAALDLLLRGLAPEPTDALSHEDLQHISLHCLPRLRLPAAPQARTRLHTGE